MHRYAIGLLVGAALILAWQFNISAQAPKSTPSLPAGGQKIADQFEFEVVESFNAKYLGDTPGHTGRGGNLSKRPSIALGDSVYRGKTKTKVGTISGIEWDRARESLTVEFDPEPFVRVALGDVCWIHLNGENQTEPTAK